MKTLHVFFCTVLILCSTLFFCCAHASAQITIVRNGGGSELIENSLVATSLAVSQGADYLELPINMSADNQLVVLKDTTLNRLTDVTDLFPTRHREDGKYYVIDFSLRELRQLRLRNIFEEDSSSLSLGIPTLTEELTLIRKLNSLLGKNTGVVIGLQEPAFYTSEGKDISSRLRQTLEILSYGPQDKIFLQCADPDELQKIGRWPQAENGRNFSLIQLINIKQSTDVEQTVQLPLEYQHNWLFTNSGLRMLSSYATAVALPAEIGQRDRIEVENILQSLRQYGIQIFIQSSVNNTTVHLQRSGETMNPSVVGSATDEADYDGIYVNSLYMSPVPEEKHEPVPVQNSEAALKTSTLPPFFSNLGLSPPKQADTKNNHETEEHIITEELE